MCAIAQGDPDEPTPFSPISIKPTRVESGAYSDAYGKAVLRRVDDLHRERREAIKKPESNQPMTG